MTGRDPGVPGVVRLAVNLHPEVAGALQGVAKRRDITVTEAVARAVAVLDLVDRACRDGDRVMLVREGAGMVTYRDVDLGWGDDGEFRGIINHLRGES